MYLLGYNIYKNLQGRMERSGDKNGEKGDFVRII
jgi:hypothetical protein